jgi:hypothetical protein
LNETTQGLIERLAGLYSLGGSDRHTCFGLFNQRLVDDWRTVLPHDQR